MKVNKYLLVILFLLGFIAGFAASQKWFAEADGISIRKLKIKNSKDVNIENKLSK